MPLDFKQ